MCPVPPCQPLACTPLGAPILLMPRPSPTLSFTAPTEFPDCHRHTDRQTDGQTVISSRSNSSSPCVCSAPAPPSAPTQCKKKLIGVGPLMATPSKHPVHLGRFPACTVTCPLGEQGPRGPRGLSQGAAWWGWGGWDGSGPAGRLGLWARGSETQRGPRSA